MIKLTPKAVVAAIMRDPCLGHDLEIKTQDDCDLFFKTVFKSKFWPEHLKKKGKNEKPN